MKTEKKKNTQLGKHSKMSVSQSQGSNVLFVTILEFNWFLNFQIILKLLAKKKENVTVHLGHVKV
jgi:hypothetical protein